jgi:predicted homoserine dehydrogenase-like protein
MNAEMDATIGPILKVYADRQGVVVTNTDGDEPGVAMNLVRFVNGVGYRAVAAGNLKGMIDPYRTPETQKAFAEKYHRKPRTSRPSRTDQASGMHSSYVIPLFR